ncbi:MAG TPA: hypothetical protein PLF13_14175 [candidate division Zixibacteria bacterium]|nr:hypothetical protein [candidate division Zixibacteria bacterium]
MRINAVFSKKVSTGQFENETFTVTVEAESEFNNIAEVSDYLFNQARSAVKRQIDGTASGSTPETSIPGNNESGGDSHQGNGSSNGRERLPATQKQQGMLHKLLKEQFEDKSEGRFWLRDKFNTDKVEELSRKTASRAIEALLDKARGVA